MRGGATREVNTSEGTEVERYRGKDRKKVSFAMRPDLHHRLKVAAAVHQRDMSEILEQALLQLLNELDAKEK